MTDPNVADGDRQGLATQLLGGRVSEATLKVVHEAVADEFVSRLTEEVERMRVGRGTEDGVRIGPLINGAAVEKADALVREAVGRGAEVRLGGGPVVSVVRFTDEADAVRIANDTEFGLVSYVFTRDLARGQRMIERLQTGMMGLNVGVISNASAPFGGVKQSGVGREGGFEGIHEYLSPKYTMTPAP